MTINLTVPNSNETPDLKPRITVIGVGGAGGNAVNNMIQSHLEGVDFVVANTDAQALANARTDRRVQLGLTVTKGLGAGSRPDIGRQAAEEAMNEILEQLEGSHMVFITAGMGGGTGTGAAPVIAKAAKDKGILTVGVVTRPFGFEGSNRMHLADIGIDEMQEIVDTLIVIPNQNLFRIANEKTTFADAFKMADDVLHQGVRSVTDLMVMPGLINLDFADIEAVMQGMGKAMMGTGEAEGERRATEASEAAISNPLLEDTSITGAQGVLISITGGMDMTLFEVDEAANLIREQVDQEANIIFGSTFDEKLDGKLRVSVVATGLNAAAKAKVIPGSTIQTETLFSKIELESSEPISGRAKEDKKTEKTPSSSPTIIDESSFIPPRPENPQDMTTTQREVDPFTQAEFVNESQSETKSSSSKLENIPTQKVARGPSLFERVTGTGHAKTTSSQAVANLNPLQSELPASTKKVDSQKTSDAASHDKRLSGNWDEDLLDIPAFLRRQSN